MTRRRLTEEASSHREEYFHLDALARHSLSSIYSLFPSEFLLASIAA